MNESGVLLGIMALIALLRWTYRTGKKRGEATAQGAWYVLGRTAGRKWGYDDGIRDGKKEGNIRGRKEGFEKGFVAGKSEGFADGMLEGLSLGFEEPDEISDALFGQDTFSIKGPDLWSMKHGFDDPMVDRGDRTIAIRATDWDRRKAAMRG